MVDVKKSFISHYADLRMLLLSLLGVWLMFSAASWVIADDLLRMLAGTVRTQLVYTQLYEPLMVRFKIALAAGIVTVFPVVMLMMTRYLEPVIGPRKPLWPLVLIGWGLFIGGIDLGYVIVLPLLAAMLKSFAGPFLVPMLTVNSYVDLALGVLLVNGLTFLMPVGIALAGKAGFFSYRHLAPYRRHTFTIILILSALLSPPDVLSMFLFAIPLYLLFEVSLLVLKFMTR
jgi:sec-independent protein translocase protein TatC